MPSSTTDPAASSQNAPPEDAPRADERRPLRSYVALMRVFNAGFAAALYAGRDRLPERFEAADLALMSVGTYKLSRLLAKDRVTSGIRAPFTRFQEDTGAAEVDERARGRGWRRAIGELLVCPYCLDQWVAGGYVAGMVLAPRVTRAVASMFTVVAGADVLQHGYKRMQSSA
jgi:hypothetical protein